MEQSGAPAKPPRVDASGEGEQRPEGVAVGRGAAGGIGAAIPREGGVAPGGVGPGDPWAGGVAPGGAGAGNPWAGESAQGGGGLRAPGPAGTTPAGVGPGRGRPPPRHRGSTSSERGRTLWQIFWNEEEEEPLVSMVDISNMDEEEINTSMNA